MPTVKRIGRYRFFFFSNEGQEPPHIHVKAGGDEAKYWLAPIRLASNHGFSGRELSEIERLVNENESEFWRHGMNTSAKAANQRAIVPTSALAKSVAFTADMMHVALIDGRVVSVPLAWFPRLSAAGEQDRTSYEIGGGGIGLHWPTLDEDISVAGLLAGADRGSA